MNAILPNGLLFFTFCLCHIPLLLNWAQQKVKRENYSASLASRAQRAVKIYKPQKDPAKGRGGYSLRTVNRILAHLKTLAKWIHKLKPFPLGNPMAKIKLMPIGNGLEIERAISPAERRRIWV